MARMSVETILDVIESLDGKDQVRLERELARRLRREWTQVVGRARKTARRRRIDQATIDRVIERRRYRA